ncbi:hypothetical protein K3495_g4815 [Podosphaera aphanis]|nr:hypothetical protein K3495_g4815 [Podosphaera aphanis]
MNLPPHMLKAYESYRSDLAEVVAWHFYAYINGDANVNRPVHNAQTPGRASPVPAMPTRATTPAPAPLRTVRIQPPNPDAFPPISKTPAAPAKILKPTYAIARERGTSSDHTHVTELQEGKSYLAPPTVFPTAAKIQQPPLCEDGGTQQMADDPYIHGAMRD